MSDLKLPDITLPESKDPRLTYIIAILVIATLAYGLYDKFMQRSAPEARTTWLQEKADLDKRFEDVATNRNAWMLHAGAQEKALKLEKQKSERLEKDLAAALRDVARLTEAVKARDSTPQHHRMEREKRPDCCRQETYRKRQFKRKTGDGLFGWN